MKTKLQCHHKYFKFSKTFLQFFTIISLHNFRSSHFLPLMACLASKETILLWRKTLLCIGVLHCISLFDKTGFKAGGSMLIFICFSSEKMLLRKNANKLWFGLRIYRMKIESSKWIPNMSLTSKPHNEKKCDENLFP